MRKSSPVVLVLAAAVAFTARLAHAHAFPEAEQPMVGSTVDSAPASVSIKFDAPIESLFAKLDVLDGAGWKQDDGTPQVGPNRRELVVKLKPLKPGEYTVNWSVVAEDGHRTEGSYTFTVGGKP